MSERSDADLFQILIGQITEDRELDVVLGKTLRVLSKTKLLKPVGDLLHRGNVPDYHFTRPHGQAYQ